MRLRCRPEVSYMLKAFFRTLMTMQMTMRWIIRPLPLFASHSSTARSIIQLAEQLIDANFGKVAVATRTVRVVPPRVELTDYCWVFLCEVLAREAYGMVR